MTVRYRANFRTRAGKIANSTQARVRKVRFVSAPGRRLLMHHHSDLAMLGVTGLAFK